MVRLVYSPSLTRFPNRPRWLLNPKLESSMNRNLAEVRSGVPDMALDVDGGGGGGEGGGDGGGEGEVPLGGGGEGEGEPLASLACPAPVASMPNLASRWPPASPAWPLVSSCCSEICKGSRLPPCVALVSITEVVEPD
eukprot:scaffold1418_cov352-Prasinococcus_capsulatus_cf.AAC.11